MSAELGLRERKKQQTRQAIVETAHRLFAERGFDGTSVEEISSHAEVSKPVVYEHFGGKEGLYAVVVDREMERMLAMVTVAVRDGVHYRDKLEQAALALLEYIEESTDGFRILVRDSHGTSGTGGFASLLSEIAQQVEHILGKEFDQRGYDDKTAPMYAQMLVGMVALTGQWWLEVRKPRREEVAAHVVNLAWNGLSRLEPKPHLDPKRRRKEREKLERRAEKAAAKAERKSRRAEGKAELDVEMTEPAAELSPPAPA
jgi:AcrR family transcriptional regulator